MAIDAGFATDTKDRDTKLIEQAIRLATNCSNDHRKILDILEDMDGKIGKLKKTLGTDKKVSKAIVALGDELGALIQFRDAVADTEDDDPQMTLGDSEED